MSHARRIGVVGAGLIGGSLIKAFLAGAGAGAGTVSVWEHDPQVRARLSEDGIPVVDDLTTLARAVDVVFIAVPPAATAQVAASVLEASPTVIVSDTASVKESVVAALAARVGPDLIVRFVPGHPLAGGELPGWEHADAALLAGALWALCPQEGRTDPRATVAVIDALTRLDGVRVLAVDAHEHDVILAHTSHMPHLAANALMRTVCADRSALRVCLSGGALRDGTRVAGADPDLWVEILRDNVAHTVDALDGLIARLGNLRGLLAEGRWPELADEWRAGADARASLVAARWSPPGEPRRYVCEEPTVGALLELGARGISIARVVRGEAPWQFDVVGG